MTTFSNAYVGPVEQQCAGKTGYRTKAQAKRVIKRLRWMPNRDSLSAYRCPHCGGFHIGKG